MRTQEVYEGTGLGSSKIWWRLYKEDGDFSLSHYRIRRYRGVVHGVFTVVFFTLAIMSALANFLFPKLLPPPWWGFTALLFGKFFNYCASAVLHLYPFKTLEGGTNALQWDLVGVAVSIGLTTFPFCRTYEEAMTAVSVTVFCVAAQVGIVVWMFSNHSGLDTPYGKSELPRNALMVLQWFDTSVRIGRSTGWGAGWLVPSLTYVLAFVLAGPVTASHMEEPVFEKYLPWHRRGVNSLHEDFHAVLLLADMMMVRLAVITLMGGN